MGTIAHSCVSRVLLNIRAAPIALLFALLAATLLLSGPPSASAQELSPISLQVEVGFDGKARVGSWTPVIALLENHGPDFVGEVHVIDTRGQSTRYIDAVVLPQGSRKRLTLHAPYQRFESRLNVELVSDGKVVVSRESRVSLVSVDDIFVGVVGQRTGPWNLLTTLEIPGQRREVVVAPISPEAFPDRPEVLESFDVIVLGDVQVRALSPGMLEALEGWVAGGGTLILPGGPTSGVDLKGLPAQLMPVIAGNVIELESASALERLGNEPFPTTYHLSVSDSQVVSGHILAEQAGVPLAVLSRLGQGSVLFLAFDPTAQPLAGWAGMPRVWRELLFQSLPPSVIIPTQAPRTYPGGGVRQWPHQLHQAMSNLPALEPPSINVLLGLIGGYILLAGPVNYVVLRRLGRPGLTWITIPALAVLFSSGAYFLAVGAKGSDVQGSAVSIIQQTHGTDWARVRSMVGVLAPRRGDYRAESPGTALVASWDSRRPRSMAERGGLGIRVRNGEERSELELLDMGMWTMRNLLTDSVQRVEQVLSYDLHIEGDRLKGTVTNKSPEPLKQVWLMAGGASEDLGALRPGDTANVNITLAGSSVGQRHWRQRLNFSSSSPASSPREQRQHQQLQTVAAAALDSFYTGPSSGLSLPVVAWTDESPMGITVNNEQPSGPSFTVFVQPATPRIQGNFSLPSGVLMGRVVDFEGQIGDPGSAEITISNGSAITFQFEAPAKVQDMRTASLHVPFNGASLAEQSVDAMMYHWGDTAWKPLALTRVSLPMQSSLSGGASSSNRGPFPQSGQGRTVFYSTPYGLPATGALEGELGDERGLDNYVSSSGLVRIQLVIRDGQVGIPSLILEGVVRE